MQSYKFDEVIRNVCQKKGLNPDLMKSFSDHIFSTAKKEMSKFENLRINLRGLVNWYYGKKRLEEFIVKVENKIDCNNQGIPQKHKVSFLEKLSDTQIEELHQTILSLQDVYEKYVQEKKEVKTAFKNAKKANTEI